VGFGYPTGIKAVILDNVLHVPSVAAFVRAWAYFSPGTGEIYLDDVSCTGNESRLIDCQYPPIGEHNCVHYEDAAVTCYSCKCVTVETSVAGNKLECNESEKCQIMKLN